MILDDIIRYLIYVHAFIGGIALAAGSLSIVFKKGGRVHKKAGKVFYVSLVVSASMALIISNSPGHKSTFLFCIGLFSLYLVISGYRALQFKSRESNHIDRLISWLMLIIGLIMISFSALEIIRESYGKGIVFGVFGIIAILLSAGDLINYKNSEKLRAKYLTLHISKISGAYIAALTAFIVTNQILPGLYGWLAPTFLGTFFIIYWIRRTVSR